MVIGEICPMGTKRISEEGIMIHFLGFWLALHKKKLFQSFFFVMNNIVALTFTIWITVFFCFIKTFSNVVLQLCLLLTFWIILNDCHSFPFLATFSFFYSFVVHKRECLLVIFHFPWDVELDSIFFSLAFRIYFFHTHSAFSPTTSLCYGKNVILV